MSTNESDTPVHWLAPDEEQSWRAYLRMVTAVQVRTAHDLAELGLSEPDYEVLSTLSEHPEGTSTLHEQAAKMGWSRSCPGTPPAWRPASSSGAHPTRTTAGAASSS